MDSPEYSIMPYAPDYLSGVAGLMVYLWGPDAQANMSYFRWKYEQNPHADETLGLVCLSGNTVVGFRGFFATKWRVGRGETVTVLCPGDTCVHPDHRRKGLSVLMGRVAMRLYEETYSIFLNTTCSPESLPGYLRMGFVPLVQRDVLAKTRLPALLRCLPPLGRLARDFRHLAWPPIQTTTLPLGQDGELVVTDRALPKEMAEIVSKRGRSPGRLTLLQDEAYFRWRFSSKRRRYSFCYLVDGQEVTGYAVLRLCQKGRAKIIDYGGVDEDCTKTLLGAVPAVLRFDVLSLWDFSVEPWLRQNLRSIGFRRDALAAFVEKRLSGQAPLPLLLRPVREEFREADWHVAGLDTRRIESWHIKEVCSDAE